MAKYPHTDHLMKALAARTRKIFHDEDNRKRIRAAAIIDRLQSFLLGDNPNAMTRTKVAAAVALLHKVLPDLRSAEVKAKDTKTYVTRAPLPAKDYEEWMAQYGPHTFKATPGTASPTEAESHSLDAS